MDTEPSRVPEGVYARIPISDLTIGEAYEQVEDPSFWDETMPALLFHFSITDYWGLRVIDHRRLWDWLAQQGLVSGDS
jgi:hypothetical protein